MAVAPSATEPAANAAAITPHNTNDLAETTRAIYVGVSGDVTMDLFGTGTNITFKSVPVGILPVQVTRVYATSTTATDMIALW